MKQILTFVKNARPITWTGIAIFFFLSYVAGLKVASFCMLVAFILIAFIDAGFNGLAMTELFGFFSAIAGVISSLKGK